MKYITIFGFIVAIFSFVSCNEKDMMVYEQNAGIFFSQTAYSFSFVDDQSLTEKTIQLTVDITGLASDKDRHFSIGHPAHDTITTAPSDQYVIGEGVVPAGEFSGTADVTVKYSPRLDERIDTLLFEILPSDDFPEARLNRSFARVAYTKMVIRPENWNWLRWYFGTPYSTRWYLFILDVTGTTLPYFPTHADKETWWMSVGEVQAYQTKVRLALEKYNRENDEPLMHDDGDNKGTPVTMP